MKRPNAIYCSKRCSSVKEKQDRDERNGIDSMLGALNTGVVGGMHELLVCVDLLKRGWYVYRSVTQSAPFDLMAFFEGKPYSIEVTTGSYSSRGEVTHAPKDFSTFNYLAVVTRDGKIFYEPPLPE